MFKPSITITKEEIPQLVHELQQMKLAELVARYRELYGEPPRSKNKGWLFRRLAWRTQELAEGGLPDAVFRRVAELGDHLPERWKIRMAEKQRALVEVGSRDPRIPAVGTTLRRAFRGKIVEVKILEVGLEMNGAVYKSLTAAAHAVTGKKTNGVRFFGLVQKRTSAKRRTTP